MRKLKSFLLVVVAVTAAAFPPCAAAGFLVKTGQALVDLGSPDAGKPATATAPVPTAKAAPNCDPVKEAQTKKDADQSEVQNGLTNHVNLSCLEKYKKFSMGTSLGYPNPWDMLQQMIGQVCSAADMKVQGATAPLNQGLPLPGGVGRVNTGAVFGSSAPSGAGVSVGSGGTSTTTTGAVNQGGSGYTVPPLWK